VAQVIDCLPCKPSKSEILSSNPSTTKNKIPRKNSIESFTNRLDQMKERLSGLEDKVDKLEYSNNLKK
jgi:hypothetical protein